MKMMRLARTRMARQKICFIPSSVRRYALRTGFVPSTHRRASNCSELFRHTLFHLTSDCYRRYLKGEGSVKRSVVPSRLRTHPGRVAGNPEVLPGEHKESSTSNGVRRATAVTSRGKVNMIRDSSGASPSSAIGVASVSSPRGHKLCP
jgi:hypothetical protein